MGKGTRLVITAQYNRYTDGGEHDLINAQLVEMQMNTNLSRNEAIKALLLAGVKHWGKPTVQAVAETAPDSSPELDRLRRELAAERAAVAEMRAWLMQIGQAVLHDLPAQIAALPTVAAQPQAQKFRLPKEEQRAPVLDSRAIQRGSSADDLQRVAAIMTQDDW
jgi:hypothetical protein